MPPKVARPKSVANVSTPAMPTPVSKPAMPVSSPPTTTPAAAPAEKTPPVPSAGTVVVDEKNKCHLSHTLKCLTKLTDQIDTQLSKSEHIPYICKIKDRLALFLKKECDELRTML